MIPIMMQSEQLTDAYIQMSFIRAFEHRLNELFLQGLIAGTTHLCVGQEACAVGVCQALKAEDCLFSNHRGHGHLLARGADPGRVMAEIFGSPRGYAGGRGGSQHMAIGDLNFMGTHGITAGTIPLAVGCALHKKLRREPGVAVVFFGDGAIGEGIFHESLNMAAIWKVPVLFVCENNQYAMSTAFRKISPVAHVVDRASAYNMEAHRVDGNDVEAVHELVAEIRGGIAEQPHAVLLELDTYRVSGHSRGDPCVYRSREEEAHWLALDPLARCRRRLEEEVAWDDAREAALREEIGSRLKAAEAFAREESY